ncbi:cytochrome P450 monooxygenase [Tricladium varicosporioides]|nr:cytochrome P450 monooxygenase [Hymenoscyphus varicosporioides]
MLLGQLLSGISLASIAIGPLLLITLLFTVISIYNYFLHPLRHIRGPLLCKLTPWVQLYHGISGDRHLWLHDLHKKYGSHVRVAPNFVSVNTVDGLHDIYGHGKKVKKADFYNAFPAIKGVYNTHNAIDKTLHGRKRRVLSQAFSDNALKGMEELMIVHIQQFSSILSNKDAVGGSRNLSDWFSYLSYDVMGELCFGKSFDMLINGARRGVIALVDRAAFRHYVCGLWMPLDSWHLDQLLIPKITRDRWNFIMNSRVEAQARAKARTEAGHEAKKDFFYYLLNAKDPETGAGFSMQELWAEANVLMIAGSDTTSTSLTATIFYLVRNPNAMAKVQKEIDAAFSNVDEIVSGQTLNSLEYLKACIDEAMRLAPPVPASIPREVLPGGATIDGVFFPPGANVGTPAFSIHRNPSYYHEPLKFIPERWIEGATCESPISGELWTTTKDSVELGRKAFCPFSIGPRGCIGKGMALMELRITLARIIFMFEMHGVDGEGEDSEGNLAMVDHFTSQKTGPNVRFRAREKA